MISEDRSLTLEVAEYVSKVSYDSIPSDVVQRAKEAFIDGLGVMLAGCGSESGEAIGRYVRDLGVSGKVLRYWERRDVACPVCCPRQRTAGHALDYDDTQISSVPDRVYGFAYPSHRAVLAASLAVAEEVGAGGKDLIAAFCAGVEVACKVAEAINPQHYKSGFHSTGTMGIFGALRLP